MKKIELTKKGLFRFMDMLGLTPEDLASIREWVTEYSARKANTLPCLVEYVGYDHDGEQNGMITVTTIHYDKLASGDPVLAHLGVPLLFSPVNVVPKMTTVADLQAEAKKIWQCHPIRHAEWNKFSTHQKTYFDLNKILKGIPHSVDLPDIRDHIFYLEDDATAETDYAIRLDTKTGETSRVPIQMIDFILCVADK